MSYGRGNLGPVARLIQQHIYDTAVYGGGTEPEPLKGDARWWAEQVGVEEAPAREGLEELVAQNTLVKHGEGEDAVYIYTSVTGLSPELQGEGS